MFSSSFTQLWLWQKRKKMPKNVTPWVIHQNIYPIWIPPAVAVL